MTKQLTMCAYMLVCSCVHMNPMNHCNKVNEHWTNNEPPHDKTNKMTCAPAKTQISLGIHPVWSESLLCAQLVAKDTSFVHADREDWSDWADAKSDLSIGWAHRSFCWFCHVVADMCIHVCMFLWTCKRFLSGFQEFRKQVTQRATIAHLRAIK